MLSLFVILMSVCGSVFAQDNSNPGIKIKEVITDEKIVLITKNFPADTTYTVSLASEENPEAYTAVARFNSKSGGSLSVPIKIPAKFQGLNNILLKLEDGAEGVFLASFENIPAEEPAVEEGEIALANQEPAAEETAQEPAAEEPAEEPAAEETAQEPAAEEPAEEPAAEETAQEPAAEEPAEEPVAEETVQEPAAEEPAEEPVAEETAQEPAAEEPAEEPAAEEPVADEPAEEPAAEETAEEPAAEETIVKPAAEETAEEPVVEETTVEEETAVEEIPVLVCNFNVTPTVKINAVERNGSVTFTTANFPKDSTFTVSMGYYVETWVPDPWTPPMPPAPHHHGPKPGPAPIPCDPCAPAPAPSFKPIDEEPSKPGPAPKGHTTVTFSGIPVGTFETGDGTAQTLTFSIPQSLYNVNPIALWISDNGPCGFYSYNYFYNNSTN